VIRVTPLPFEEAAMITVGSVEYVVIGFSGQQFRTRVAPALADLVGRGTVHVWDVVFITKDGFGDVEMQAYDPCHDRFACLSGLDITGGLVSDLDAIYAAEELAPGTTAALVAWERPGEPGVPGSWGPAHRPSVARVPIPHEVARVALDDLVSV
jgi:hypothetical protein